MNILAIDPGSLCGWALLTHGNVESGVQDFTLKRGESKGMRFFNFRTWIARMLRRAKIDLVIYEQAHLRGGAATDVGVGFTTRIQEECDMCDVKYTPIHSATLKKFATGSGRANKELMLGKAREKWGDLIEDHNEADALWILEWARKEYGKLK